ncbi:flavodoxin domain-containing protein [Microbacterium sp. SS28]|uniref:flavodoxin family protein n=1 Tax=Microbacterium sp. SS28 TaxID=2919948 RepID=UPI001FAA5B25|nr:flavodoxin domain-containing protein [Microbacterium sp. SS28]
MNALIVYESMFGNTRQVADAMREALESTDVEVTLTTAAGAPADLGGFELVIVGAPTHAHTLPQPTSRVQGGAWADDPEKDLRLEPGAHEPGVREWIERIATPDTAARFASFSTRVDIPRIFSGDAALAIAKRLRKRGIVVTLHADFLVDRDSHLLEGEVERAHDWATQLLAVPSR